MNSELINIEGAGGGKGGGGGSATEAPNTLRSINTVRVLEIISEGECEGLVGGAKGIYFNDTPLQNSDGTYNYNNVTWAERQGLPDQSYMEGFPSAEADYAVGINVTTTNPGLYTTTSPNIDAVRVSLLFPGGLSYQDPSNGNLNGTFVQLAIDTRLANGVWAEAINTKVEGKTTSQYQQTFRVERPAGSGVWQVRVRRITEDAPTANYRNSFTFSIASEILDVKLSYPYTAYVGVAIDAESFGQSIPKRSYRYRGIKCNVPTNYDPTTGTFTGIWNGTFKRAWTDDPAWVLYDIMTNVRYGLGEFITEDELDKFSFYDASVYNNQLVPDGNGGYERRFTFNTQIAAQESALKVIQAIAGSMMSTVVRSPNGYRINQDRPASPVKLITNSDVIGGLFTYTSTSLQERHTVAQVTFNDKNDRYLRATTTIEADSAAIAKYGWNPKEISAYGATTEGQAIRAGRWLLETELNQTRQVIWKSSFKHFDLQVGDIVELYDDQYTRLTHQGRLEGAQYTGANTYQVRFDRKVTLSNTPGTVKYSKPDGSYVTASISSEFLGATGTWIEINVPSGAVPPSADSTFIIEQAISAQQYRIMRVTLDQSAPNILEVEGLLHDPDKYARVEQGISTTPPVYSDVSNTTMPDVKNISFRVSARVTDEGIRRDLLVSWEPPYNTQLAYFKVQYRKDTGNWITESRLTTPAFEIQNIVEATYDVIVYCYSKTNVGSKGKQSSFTYSLGAVGESALHQPTDLHIRNGVGTDFDTADLSIEFTNDPSNASVTNAHLKDFVVTVRDQDLNLLRTDYVPRVEAGAKQYYTYSFGQNTNDGGPRRTIRISVQARDTDNKLSGATSATFTNPVPMAPNVQLQSNVKMVQVDVFDTGYEKDIQGIVVCASTNAGDLTTEAGLLDHIVYKGQGYFYQIQTEDTAPLYVRVAFYDSFGSAGLNYSAIATATPGTKAGIPEVTVLPNSPADVNGNTGVMYKAPGSSEYVLYGWDGTKWMNTRDGGYLIENSVVASKIYAEKLSAINANMGDITSGTLTLDAGGFIRGGATSYGVGTGFWQGYHDNNFKWRVGTPGHAGAAWDGTNFIIYDANGNITLQSGQNISADWNNLLNKPTSISAISSSEANKLAGIEAGATVGAPAGTLVAGVSASTIATAATNFNTSNDRNSTAVVAPTIATDGTAVDHTLNSNGSADISFEWGWSGSEGDIDGFIVYMYQSSSSAAYTFGSNPSAETTYSIPASKRAFIAWGVTPNKYYSFGIRAYRRVDKDIAASGMISSAIIQPTRSDEKPYLPSSSVAFSGDITGTINGYISTGAVNVWAYISGTGRPEDNATFGATVGTNLKQNGSTVNSIVSDVNKISSTNISTFMTSAAIGTAYIGDASVNTLKLAGNAVTTQGQAQSSSGSASFSVYLPYGGSGIVMANCYAQSSTGSGPATSLTLQISCSNGQSSMLQGQRLVDNADGGITVSAMFTLAAGTHYFTANAVCPNRNTLTTNVAGFFGQR